MIDLNEADESCFDLLFAESESLVSEGFGYYRIEVEAGDITNLITRLREAEKDAARYRWLRDAPATSASEPIRHWMWSRPYGANMKYLDDAIDQAIKEKGDE